LEWEPDERDAWVADAERWIGQINGVLQCKIDLDHEGEVTGVHVVAGMEREPRHIVRDVEGLLKARIGVNVFYKKIGVVQVLEEGAEEAAEPVAALSPGESGHDAEATPAVILEEIQAPRILCNGVGVMVSDRSVRAEVELQAGAVEARGVEEGSNHADCDLHLIGRATLMAVGQLLAEPVVLDLSEIRLAEMAGQPVVLAAVEVVEGRRSERLFGSCPAVHNRPQAAVYAVLDAVNRRLSLMAFKSPEVAD